MDELLLNFLGREREKTVRIGERTCAMRLLSARETLSLRREIAQLRRANEILKTASAFFAQAELDRKLGS